MTLRELLWPFKSNWSKKNMPEKYQEGVDKYYAAPLHDIIKENVEWFVNHPKLSRNHEIYFQLFIQNLANMTFDEIMELDKKFNKCATGIFGLEYDNSAKLVLTDINGYIYKFFIHKTGNTYGFSLWDDTGYNALHSISTRNNKLTAEEYKHIQKIMHNYQRSIVNCSDCGNETYLHEIAGRYFAGRYCKTCWEGKWKAIEAKETYD